jgi:hypothetical protein
MGAWGGTARDRSVASDSELKQLWDDVGDARKDV